MSARTAGIAARAGFGSQHADTRTVLVTGASGFIGSHLVDLLTAHKVPVRKLVRSSSAARYVTPPRGVESVVGTLDDAGPLTRAVNGASVVFHLAGVTSAATPHEYLAANVVGTRRLVATMQTVAPDALLVLCSSLAAVGPVRSGRPLEEDVPPQPVSEYGRSKLAAEQLVRESGLRHVIVRPPIVYGPRDRDLLALFQLAALGIALRVGPPGQRLSLVHVSDLVNGFLLAAHRGQAGDTYHLSDGSVHSWECVIDAIATSTVRPVRTIPVPGIVARAIARGGREVARLRREKPLLTPDRVREMSWPDWSCSDQRARQELGYRSEVDLTAGMMETCRWYRQAGWL